jgi:arylamine N-acetyltransferase
LCWSIKDIIFCVLFVLFHKKAARIFLIVDQRWKFTQYLVRPHAQNASPWVLCVLYAQAPPPRHFIYHLHYLINTEDDNKTTRQQDETRRRDGQNNGAMIKKKKMKMKMKMKMKSVLPKMIPKYCGGKQQQKTVHPAAWRCGIYWWYVDTTRPSTEKKDETTTSALNNIGGIK